MTVKVGDKVRVVKDWYPKSLPRGYETNVLRLDKVGGVTVVVVESIQGYNWFLFDCEYELVSDPVPVPATLISTQCRENMEQRMSKGEYVRAVKWAQIAEQVKELEDVAQTE